MAQAFRNDLRVDAELQSQRRVGVPEIVEADDWYAGGAGFLLKTEREESWNQWGGIWMREDKVALTQLYADAFLL